MIVVLVTCPRRAEGEKIARTLVRERLAACANLVGNVTSIFSWKGKIERAREVLLVIKTRRVLFERLKRRVRELHSYTVPEIIALQVRAGNREYLAWLEKETRP